MDLFGTSLSPTSPSTGLTSSLPPTPISKKLSLDDAFRAHTMKNSIKENVTHVLLSEFDLEKGSVMRCQYPNPVIGADENYLADMMLPDGVHNRLEDWTMFFLNRDSKPQKQSKPDANTLLNEVDLDKHFERGEEKSVQATVHGFDEERNEWVSISQAQTTITFQGYNGAINSIYGRFLIQDSKIKIAITEELKYQVLEDQHKDSGLHFVSLQDFPSSAPVGLLLDETSESMLMNWIIEINEAKQAAAQQNVLPFLYCINFVRTKKDSTMKRGASVKSLALCSPHPYFYVFKGLLRHAMELIFESGEEPETIIQDLYRVINELDLSTLASSLSPTQKKVWRYSIVDKDIVNHPVKLLFRGKSFNLLIPLAIDEDEIGDERASVIKFISKFKSHTMTVYNAILEERRVLFVGHNQSASDVCFIVLSAIMLVAPPITNLLRTRVFPYQSLTLGDEFTNVKGYIAGVTNPMFKQREEMWDLLCDLDTGEVIKNEKSYQSSDQYVHELSQYPPDGHDELDQQFLQQIVSMVNSHALKGVNHSYSEDSVRSHFQEYTKRIMKMVLGDAIFEDDDAKVSMENKNMYRLLLLRDVEQRNTFANYIETRHLQRMLTTIDGIDAEEYVSRLRICQDMSETEVLSIFQDFVRHIRTHQQLLEFLSLLPEAQGGLYPIAVVLFHPSEAVRLSAVAFLRRIDTIKEGNCCISQLNTFLMLTYDRTSRVLPQTD
ncbi:hypothetical protein AKO1_007912 [Acrasis kona]|uniref:UDENN domain-containing protein n=1 Tax=Acrasis kona TaxID=1008807 RepID=A0AAW2YP92_9EUKA